MLETIDYKGTKYPALQSKGFAAKFAFPFAKEICKGTGYDIGCNRLEWKFPDARGIDLTFEDGYDAYNLPEGHVDFIFSSHVLEHLPNWVDALDYWFSKINVGGILFLYLPHPSQNYWAPFANRKHIHSLSPALIKNYFEHQGVKNFFVTEYDLNNSFYAVAEKND